MKNPLYRGWGMDSLTNLYKKDTPGETPSSYNSYPMKLADGSAKKPKRPKL